MAGNFQGAQQVPRQLGTMVKWGALVVGIVVIFVVLSLLRSLYTDLLWYGAQELRSVYVKVLVTRIVLALVGVGVTGALLALNLYFANKFSRAVHQTQQKSLHE